MLVRRKTNEGFNSNLLHNGWFLNTIHRVLMCDDSFLNFSEHFCWTSLTGNPTNVYIIPLTNHSEIFETLQLRFLKLFPTETFQNTTAMNKQALVVEKKFCFSLVQLNIMSLSITCIFILINIYHLLSLRQLNSLQRLSLKTSFWPYLLATLKNSSFLFSQAK